VVACVSQGMFLALEKLRVDMLTICRRAQLRQIQTMSYLEAAYVANTSHLHPARKSSRPGHYKARPGQRVKLRFPGISSSDTRSWLYTGHAATLTTVLDQATDSTKVTFTLDGVPKGMEDETRRNLEGY
jgi:hypothetical protein